MSIIEKAIEKLGADQERSQELLETEPDQQTAGMPGKESEKPATDNAAAVDDESSADRPEDVVQLPFDLLRSLGMVTPDEPRSIIAEENRIIKRPLLMNIAGQGAAKVANPNLIMVTSAQPAEGKTFSAINLAISIAMEQDKTVLFVDADVARAAAAALLGIPDDCPGLIDLLMDKVPGSAMSCYTPVFPICGLYLPDMPMSAQLSCWPVKICSS